MTTRAEDVTYLRNVLENVIITPRGRVKAKHVIDDYENSKIDLVTCQQRLGDIHPSFTSLAEIHANSVNVTVPQALKSHSLAMGTLECDDCEECEECAECEDCAEVTGIDVTCEGEGEVRGVFCKCSDASTIVTTPVATGNTLLSLHQANMYVCMSLVQDIGTDYYYSPDGTSAGCVHFDPEAIGTLCHMMLTGDVTSCGDPE